MSTTVLSRPPIIRAKEVREVKAALRIFCVVFFALFVISGAIGLVSTLLGVTFGLVGAAARLIWNLLFNPLVLILIIAVLAYQLYRKSRPC